MATELQFSDHRKVGILNTLFLALGSSQPLRKQEGLHSASHTTQISTVSNMPGSVPGTTNTVMDRAMDPDLMELTT